MGINEDAPCECGAVMAPKDRECGPIDTLQELYTFARNPPQWSEMCVSRSRRCRPRKNELLHKEGYSCHTTALAKSTDFIMENSPKTLVCHDMMNGYHDDRFIDGSDDHSSYVFYHWAAIDIFVYFSHHFVTLPPLSWINVAHKHGVQILGTFITEWDAGSKICNQILESEDEMLKVIDDLVTVSRFLKLDGWLLNIENKVTNVNELMRFVNILTREMHRAIPDSVVIWYDSVTVKGSLEWQNCLNENNKSFFDICDGIFTNYTWNITHLEKCVSNAGNRKHDVYIGVDVWGRNFWGGGCFNTVEAVKEIYKFGLSLAIFAPAWTHEAIEKNTNNNLLSYGDGQKCAIRNYFILRENAFWNTLWPYLYTKGPKDLPFHTYFCLGVGDKKRVNGKVIENGKTWYNLREQQYQISVPICSLNFVLKEDEQAERRRSKRSTENGCLLDANSEEIITKCEEASLESCPSADDKTKRPIPRKIKVYKNTDTSGCFQRHMDDSFHGGSCLKVCPVRGCDSNGIEPPVIMRLLHCEFKCHQNFIVYYAMKKMNDAPAQNLHLVLSLYENQIGQMTHVELCNNGFVSFDVDSNSVYLHPINFQDGRFQTVIKNLKTYHPNYYMSSDGTDWEIRYYFLSFPNSTIMDIGCKLINDKGSVLLGGLGLLKDIPTS